MAKTYYTKLMCILSNLDGNKISAIGINKLITIIIPKLQLLNLGSIFI
jgi:hypothetical protein